MVDFYHICFIVPDIERAMADLHDSVGVEWGAVLDDTVGPWKYQVTFSASGAPYYELIRGPAGSPWDATLGARCDHIAYWTDSVENSSGRLKKQGLPVDFTGCPYGRPYSYHRIDSLGVRLELMDASRQPKFLSAWNPGGAAMPALDS